VKSGWRISNIVTKSSWLNGIACKRKRWRANVKHRIKRAHRLIIINIMAKNKAKIASMKKAKMASYLAKSISQYAGMKKIS
jgi:hypothetical protein